MRHVHIILSLACGAQKRQNPPRMMLGEITLAATTDETSPILVFIIGVLVLMVVVAWIVFPFLVNNGLNRIQKHLAKQNDLLGQINDRENETNKALQWIVNNWTSRQ